MNKTKLDLRQSWEAVKEQLKENDPSLTDEDLLYEPGHAEQLLEHLSKKLNRTKEEVRILIESISANTGKAS
ncbi:MAG: general stress protein CsbD [Sphingobacteriales bacterium]|nr:general stress protein CsbD [Sphingobacteriales bacterium]OJY86153.1 MAG: hypothetical protein BGP14_16885 [Sphingobacteriales bacterium 44-15]